MSSPSDLSKPDLQAATGSAFLPGATIGILGSGQLGRMLAMAAKRMGYGVHIFSPDQNTPAGQVADRETSAAYTDIEALQAFGRSVDVVTIEFENIPVSALEALQAIVPVYPQPHVLHHTQHRLREKRFLQSHGIPVVPFAAVETTEDLQAALDLLTFPVVLKTAGFGYDGKGQARVNNAAEAEAAWAQLQAEQPGCACILEEFIDLDREISVIVARTNQRVALYPPVENRHQNHILDLTLAPAEIPPDLESQALAVSRQIAEAFDLRGLLCVEFFISKSGKLLVNELAPRPHNSGHYSIEASVCSQFEQQLRAVCGLPLGDTSLRQPAVMKNLLGDCWQGGEPDWASALEIPGVYLHLYGKADPRPGRKMGHLTAIAESRDAAVEKAEAAYAALLRKSPV